MKTFKVKFSDNPLTPLSSTFFSKVNANRCLKKWLAKFPTAKILEFRSNGKTIVHPHNGHQIKFVKNLPN